MSVINLQMSFIIERCKRIVLLLGIINLVLVLIIKTIADLIIDIILLLCTILIPIVFLSFIWRLFFSL